KPGSYIVAEQSQAGWTESLPGGSEIGRATCREGESEAGNNVGNYQQATKSGIKFNDLDADGVKDAGEPGLPGWTIVAYADTGSVVGALDDGDTAVASVITGANAAYSLTLKPGSYIVAEQSQAGWTESLPGGS